MLDDSIDPEHIFTLLAPASINQSETIAKLFVDGYATRETHGHHLGKELRDALSNQNYDDPNEAAVRFDAFNVINFMPELFSSCTPIVSDMVPESTLIMNKSTVKITFLEFKKFEETVAELTSVIVIPTEELKSTNKNKKTVYTGEIISCSNQLVIKTKMGQAEQFKESAKYHVFLKPMDNIYKAFNDTFKKLKLDKSLSNKIFGDRSFDISKEAFIKNRITDMEQDQPCRIEPFLNKAQREAIYSIQMQSPDNTFVLFGPPGTGKTTTLTEAIKSIMKHPQDKKSPKFLVCTPSNMAADNFGIALMKSNAVPKSKILRILASRFEFSMIDDALKDIVYTCNNMLALPDRDDFMKYDVVISTIGCSTKLRRFGTKHFTHILIDEAGQTTEPETLIPFFLLSNPNTRFIMAGDPKQLGPVIVNNVLNKPMFRFDESLLMRLAEKTEYQEDPRLMIQLTDNHRSHEVIVTAASEIIYNGTLVHTCPDGHDFFSGHKILNYNPWPIRFHAVFGQEQGMDSKYNKEEANVVADYVKKLLDHTPELSQFDIGIISPYKEQGRQLTNALSRYRDITIDTVEKFQGSERRVIIMSTTRTKGLGFVDEIRRFNTAITRAQQLLIVVGHPNALVKSNFWRIFMHYCASNDCFYANDEDDVLKWKAYFMNETVPRSNDAPDNTQVFENTDGYYHESNSYESNFNNASDYDYYRESDRTFEQTESVFHEKRNSFDHNYNDRDSHYQRETNSNHYSDFQKRTDNKANAYDNFENNRYVNTVDGDRFVRRETNYDSSYPSYTEPLVELDPIDDYDYSKNLPLENTGFRSNEVVDSNMSQNHRSEDRYERHQNYRNDSFDNYDAKAIADCFSRLNVSNQAENVDDCFNYTRVPIRQPSASLGKPTLPRKSNYSPPN